MSWQKNVRNWNKTEATVKSHISLSQYCLPILTSVDSNFEHLFFTVIVTVRENLYFGRLWTFSFNLSLDVFYMNAKRFMAMLHFTSCMTVLKTQLASDSETIYTKFCILSTFGSNRPTYWNTVNWVTTRPRVEFKKEEGTRKKRLKSVTWEFFTISWHDMLHVLIFHVNY